MQRQRQKPQVPPEIDVSPHRSPTPRGEGGKAPVLSVCPANSYSAHTRQGRREGQSDWGEVCQRLLLLLASLAVFVRGPPLGACEYVDDDNGADRIRRLKMEAFRRRI